MSEQQLCEELESYCRENDLPLMSADELREELRVHIEFLDSFIVRWEEAAKS